MPTSEAARLAVPQASPGREYEAQRAEIDAAIQRVLGAGWYILGREVEAFESEFAGYLGVGHGIGVASGTDALELALRGLGIGPGDEVFTVSHTAVATVAAIERAGATPSLVDIDPVTFTMGPDRLDQAIRTSRRSGSTRPRAVVVVHLYGRPADIAGIAEVTSRHGLALIEDCAQAHGARVGDRLVGTFGAVSSFSFYPTKNLGALGDGGLVATNHPDVAERVRELRQYGWRERYVSSSVGVNSRLDELQAAVLRVKLAALEAGNARRAVIAARYSAGLSDAGLTLPSAPDGIGHAFHQYVVRSPARESLRAWLGARGVGSAIHYPMPVHLQPAYRGRIRTGGMEATERAASEILSLPMFAALSDQEIDQVVGVVSEWARDPERAVAS